MVRVAARSSRAGSWEPTPRREVSGFPPHSTCGMRVRPSCHVRGSGASLRVWRPSDQGWWRQWLRELLGVELSWGTGLMAYAIGHPLFPAAWTEIKLRSRLWVPNLSRGVPRIVIVLGSPTLNGPWTSSQRDRAVAGHASYDPWQPRLGVRIQRRRDPLVSHRPPQPAHRRFRHVAVQRLRGHQLDAVAAVQVSSLVNTRAGERAPASAAPTLGGCSSCIHSPRTCRSRTRSRGRTSCTGSLRLVRRR